MGAGRSGQDPDAWFQGPPWTSSRLDELSQRVEALRGRGAPAESNGGGDGSASGDVVLAVRTADETGLTTKEVAERRGTPLWTLERRDANDQERAQLTPEVTSSSSEDRATAQSDKTTTRVGSGTGLILVSLTVLIVIRFFTEVVVILPRPVQFIDIPIFIVIVGAALLRPRPDSHISAAHQGRKLMPIFVLGFLFLVVSTGSILANPSRVDLAPALVFLYGFLGPLGLFVAVYRLWPVGAAMRMSKLLVALCLLQIGVAFSVNLPQFLVEQNPDFFTGTFGENPYQLVFFLLVGIGLLTGIFTFEKQRRVARFVPLLLVAILAIILLAQYRALLLTLALTVVLLGGLLVRSGGRGAVAATLAAAALLATLAFTVQNIPALKFGTTIEQAREDPTFYLEKRSTTAGVVMRLFGEDARYVLTGTGPGTYSSRAWYTFAWSGPNRDAVGDYIVVFTGGRRYTTDVADKYVVPQLDAEVVGGSRAVTSPLSSYLSLLAEVGVLGFAAIVAAYAWVLLSSLRMTLVSVRTAKPGDPLPALLCATTVAFFLLLQMAVLENWLEVTRITFLSWILFAVVTKEFGARARGT